MRAAPFTRRADQSCKAWSQRVEPDQIQAAFPVVGVVRGKSGPGGAGRRMILHGARPADDGFRVRDAGLTPRVWSRKRACGRCSSPSA